MTKTFFCFALGLLVIFGNATSIVIFWRRRFFLRRSTILLINLTTADLLVGFVIIFTMLEDILPSYFINREVYSEINVGFDAFALLSSILFLASSPLFYTNAPLHLRCTHRGVFGWFPFCDLFASSSRDLKQTNRNYSYIFIYWVSITYYIYITRFNLVQIQ